AVVVQALDIGLGEVLFRIVFGSRFLASSTWRIGSLAGLLQRRGDRRIPLLLGGLKLRIQLKLLNGRVKSHLLLQHRILNIRLLQRSRYDWPSVERIRPNRRQT